MTASDVLDRVIGSVVGMAAGDALGAGYEFTHPGPDTPIIMKGGGGFGWAPGEWTDDTAMGTRILKVVAGGALNPSLVGDGFLAWYHDNPKDIGNQTRAVLSHARSGAELGAAAAEFQTSKPDAAGNGSLMRTAAVALAHPQNPEAIAASARIVSDLTHPNPTCGDACVLWSIAIDHAIHHGEFDVERGLNFIPEERRPYWESLIAEAETGPPSKFTPNGWVITAFQAAWSSIVHTPIPEHAPADHFQNTLVTAVRIGHDTDTVAAIAGMLLGARWGVSAIPLEWKGLLHGWPGWRTRDLTRHAALAYEGGTPKTLAWPNRQPDYGSYDPVAVPLASDSGIVIGNVAAVADVDTDMIVSLCRMGPDSLRNCGDHIDAFLIDKDGDHHNPNLEFVFRDTVDAIARWRAEGRTVFVHCVHAQSRTPTIAAAYLIRHHAKTLEEAKAEVTAAIGSWPWNKAFLVALDDLEASIQ